MGAALVGAALSGCAVGPQAHAPVIPVHADESTRRSIYEEYALTGHVGAFHESWKRADGEYTWSGLKGISSEYPDTASVYRRRQTQRTWIAAIGDAGAGIIGGTLGWNLGASDQDRMPGDAQVALYAVGGGLVALSFVLLFTSHDPAAEFAETYNAALRRELGLPESAGEPAHGASMGAPRAVGGDHGLRFW
jgi:hypothetical protein